MKIKETKLGNFLYRVGLFLLFYVLIQIPPMAVAIANRRPDNQGVAIVMSSLFVLIFLFIINRASYVFHRYNQLPQRTGIKVGTIIGGYLVVVVGMMFFSWLNEVIFHQSGTANNELIRQMLDHNRLVTGVFVISSFTLTPVAEELIFRGLLTNLFFKPARFWPKVILSGIAFSSAHASTTIVSFFLYCFMGMVLAYVYRKTGNIKNSMLIHALNNAVAIAALMHSI
ncbi:CPBP family intramembrane metalloprotease [Limosilactobacillus panis]|uniref:CPBP family intramembrane glutamic endopeptidase n=1 Tax=Limosilactobacillus panis TaxID=47493 RepID=UPI001C96B945|nr:type II CAAX endopeptidase family protein [Limosilactobacillus panis]QZN92537.1 CPBP family intramembrane metalloprotease [Limosilactobacillus panis]